MFQEAGYQYRNTKSAELRFRALLLGDGRRRLVQNRQEAIAKLERDKESLLEHYAAIAPEALDSLAPEERHQLYKMLRLEVVVRLDANLEVKGVFGEGLLVSNLELVPGFQEDLARHRV